MVIFVLSAVGLFISLFAAGFLRGMFEVLLIFDTLKLWLGDRYSRRSFEASKDTNHDGDVSYWEKTFPPDGGHRTKLWEVILLSLSLFFAGSVMKYGLWYLLDCQAKETAQDIYYFCWIPFPYLLIPIAFLVYSAGFRFSFRRYREVPPGNDDGDIFTPPHPLFK